MAEHVRTYGHIPDSPDLRDHVRAIPKAASLPRTCDLRNLCPPVYDQGQLGSCSANAIAAAIEFDLRAAARPNWMPSRLFIYYNERAKEDTVRKDAGAQIRDGVKSIAKLGICPEALWPYDVHKFAEKPSTGCFRAAKDNHALHYEKIAQVRPDTLEQVLNGGKPILFGFTVYDSFEGPEVAQTGVMKLPGKLEGSLGGHAVLCVGYDRPGQRFLIRNSWGTGWGLGGYFWMPYEFLCDPKQARDFWVLDSLS